MMTTVEVAQVGDEKATPAVLPSPAAESGHIMRNKPVECFVFGMLSLPGTA